MTTMCAFCVRRDATKSGPGGCLHPGSETCRTEKRLEDLAHAINDSYNRVSTKWKDRR